MRGVPRDRLEISAAAAASIGTSMIFADRRALSPRRVVRPAVVFRRPAEYLLEIGRGEELEPMRDPEPRSQRRRQQAGPRRRADQRERLEAHLPRPPAPT